MSKKFTLALALLLALTVLLAACFAESASAEDPEVLTFFYTADFDAISGWGPMVTPGGGEGSVTKGDNAAIVKAAEDGWGGVQSDVITLDLSQNPFLFVQIMENHDGFKWGAKFTPSDPLIEDHAWGFYLIPDNNFKWNSYAVVDLTERLGDYIDLYGETIEGVLWIYAAGGPDAEVEVTSVKIANTGNDPFFYTADFNAISGWGPMVTPGGGEGSVTKGDNAAIVRAAEDGWGGVQSDVITLDLSQNPFLFVQIMENHDGFKWGAKFTPSDPLIEDHAWGFYLIPDNNLKWNLYAAVDLTERLGDYIDLYGETIEGVLWVYAAGGPDAEVEVTSVKIANTK